jgi:hypothetical protein
METERKPAEATSANATPVETPVVTVTAKDAVTINGDNVIVANINGKYKRFDKVEHVPAGCRTYTSKAELRGQTKKQLETIYSYVKGCDPKNFKDHDTAVDNVWHAFSQLPAFDPIKDDPEGQERRRKAAAKNVEPTDAGDKKKSYQKKREENKYVIKPETEKSKKMVSELAPQAQDVVAIIRKDGRPLYTELELRALMDANKEKLRTRQTAWRIFQYYRSNLIGADVLVQQ